MNKRKFIQLIVLFLCIGSLVKSEEAQRTVFVKNCQNTVYLDTEVGLGILYGIRYERVLTQMTTVEIGMSPINVFGYRGMVIPLGANLFLPLGNTHRIAVMVRALFYAGGDPGGHEEESNSFTAEFNRRQRSLLAYGLYYQFYSEYSITYRIGAGLIISEPVITAGIGYCF